MASACAGQLDGATAKRLLLFLPEALSLGAVVLFFARFDFGPVILQPHGGGYSGEHDGVRLFGTDLFHGNQLLRMMQGYGVVNLQRGHCIMTEGIANRPVGCA